MRLFIVASSSAFATALFLCCGGCFTIPALHGSEMPRNNFDGVAGGPETTAKVRVGQSDRRSVVAALGEPDFVEGMGRQIRPDYMSRSFWEYRHLTAKSYFICLIPGPCNGLVNPDYVRDDFLAIWFDEQGRVKKYVVYARMDGGPPPDVVAEQERGQRAPVMTGRVPR